MLPGGRLVVMSFRRVRIGAGQPSLAVDINRAGTRVAEFAVTVPPGR